MEYTLINPINEDYTPLEQILTNRGIKYEDIPHYLNVGQEDNLSPLLLDNMREAAQLLLKHVNDNNAKIYVQVDSDYDGYSSAALLLNYIYASFPSAVDKFYYDFHSGKQHGINLDLIPEGTTLVIAPDSASNDYELHKFLKDKGIDVLVLDHHQAERVSEYACVVNNQLCDYPTKSLSGVGVVYKLCQYIDSIQGTDIANQFIDLVATGLVGDMMALTDFETRYLVNQGLQSTARRNPFIKGMAEKNAYQLGTGDLTPIGVAFYIVPLVNAVTRVGSQTDKKILFDSMLDWKAYNLVPSTKRGCKGQMETILEQSLRTCTNVKNHQTKSQDKAVELVEEIIKRDNLLDHKVLLIKVNSPTFEREVTG